MSVASWDTVMPALRAGLPDWRWKSEAAPFKNNGLDKMLAVTVDGRAPALPNQRLLDPERWASPAEGVA
jgi:hypothetical protein